MQINIILSGHTVIRQFKSNAHLHRSSLNSLVQWNNHGCSRVARKYLRLLWDSLNETVRSHFWTVENYFVVGTSKYTSKKMWIVSVLFQFLPVLKSKHHDGR